MKNKKLYSQDMQHYIEKMNIELNCVYVEKRERKKSGEKRCSCYCWVMQGEKYIYILFPFFLRLYIYNDACYV